MSLDGAGRDLLSIRRRTTPAATALVRASDGRTWSYADLDDAVGRVAGRLVSLGVEPGDRLGACLGTRPAAAELVHAAARVGVTLVPFGPRLTARELADRADRAGVTAVVCDASTEPVVRAAVGADAASPDGEAPSPGALAATGPLPIASVDPPDAAGTVALRPTRETHTSDEVGETADTAAARDPGTDDPGTGGIDRPEEDSDDGVGAVGDDTVEEGQPPSGGASSEANRDDGDGTADAGGTVEPYEWDADEPLLVLSTSGTTGTPKLVRVTPRMVVASAVASAFRLGVTPDDRWYDPLSVHHTGGVMPLYRATLYGTAVVLRDEFDAPTALADLQAHDVTGVSVVPTMLRRLFEAADGPEGPDALPSSLRTVLLGGAPAGTDLIEACRERSVPVHPTYGMTETASQVATARPSEAFAHPESVGRPLVWTDVTIVDEDGEPLPEGTAGEVVVDGPTVTPGYESAGQVNSEASNGDAADGDATDGDAATGPADPNEAFGPLGFHTGDVGRLDDGRLTVLNRLDDRIVTGGENVDPGEVRDVLRAHPAVDDAAVVGVPDPEWGERVAAALVPASGDTADLDVAAVESFCRERLAGFKLPRRWRVVDDLPRTASGTVERPAVRALFADEDADRDHEGDAVATGGTATDGDPDAGADGGTPTDE